MGAEALGASYRDPCGFVYTRDGTLYRQVNRVFQDRYKAFLDSGLYAELVEGRLLVPHREVSLDLAASAEAVGVDPRAGAGALRLLPLRVVLRAAA